VVLHTGALALWLEDTAHWSFPAPVDPAQIVSPVGAGDAFCAGVIYGIHQGWTPDAALTLGHSAAAASLQGATATDGIPPLKDLL
jgi:sugar/nucleoside kinase (ribokinase family)